MLTIFVRKQNLGLDYYFKDYRYITFHFHQWSVFELYVLPIFRYGLFLWFPNCSSSSHSSIDSVFTKFLKRYLRIPKHSNNALTYLLTQTEPLTYSLKNLLRSSYSSLTLPNIFSGYKPSIAEQISSDTVTYDPSEFLPEHYKHAPIPTVLSTDPTRRHKSLKYTFDTIHYSYCNNSVFHFPNDQCICKFCSQECIFFHFQCCPVGILWNTDVTCCLPCFVHFICIVLSCK